MKWLFQRLRRLSQAKIGRKTRIWSDAVLRADGGSIKIGDQCHIHNGVLLLAEGGSIHIGDECSLNPYAVIHGAHGVQLGRQVRVATHVVIASERLETMPPDFPLQVTIEDDVWLGCNVVVLQGVRIGKGSVIGAGSVVRSDIEPFSIAVGSPARIVKSRRPSLV